MKKKTLMKQEGDKIDSTKSKTNKKNQKEKNNTDDTEDEEDNDETENTGKEEDTDNAVDKDDEKTNETGDTAEIEDIEGDAYKAEDKYGGAETEAEKTKMKTKMNTHEDTEVTEGKNCAQDTDESWKIDRLMRQRMQINKLFILHVGKRMPRQMKMQPAKGFGSL